MRILVALGGNALLRRGEEMTAENQRRNVRLAAEALAPLAREHQLVITHGNGPQVGLLALQSAAYRGQRAYPLDVLGAQTEGMIGYMIEQELGNLLPFEQPFATILSMVEVDPDDPAFEHPSKPIGPVYTEGSRAASPPRRGGRWRRTATASGGWWRRRCRKRIFQIRPVKWLLEKGCIVICAGGGGIPTMYAPGRRLQGIDAVVDKDRASACWPASWRWTSSSWRRTPTPSISTGGSHAAGDPAGLAEGPRRLRLRRRLDGPQGRGGGRVRRAHRQDAAIGALADVTRIARGEAGTIVTREAGEVEFYPA